MPPINRASAPGICSFVAVRAALCDRMAGWGIVRSTTVFHLHHHNIVILHEQSECYSDRVYRPPDNPQIKSGNKWLMLFQRIKGYLLLGILVPVAFSLYIEFLPESTFELASDSRLPKWVNLPPGLTRGDVSLTMSYYILPGWKFARFVLRDKNGQVIKGEIGNLRCSRAFEPENPPEGSSPGYPAYEAVRIDGITELIDHKKMEPIFYVTDDPAVWKQYESIGCG